MILQIPPKPQAPLVTWEKLPDDFILPDDPVENIQEFLSETETGEYSVRPTYPYGKLYFYEQILGVPTYAIFDPYEPRLEVRRLQDGEYILEEPTEEGRYWIPELELFLGIWYGERLGSTAYWLRWWDESGNLLLWSAEQALVERQRAEQERQRAEGAITQLEAERQRNELLLDRLRSLGIDPDAIASD